MEVRGQCINGSNKRELLRRGGMTKSLDVIRIQVASNRVFGEERRNISSVKDEEKRTKNGALRNTVLDLNPGSSSVAKDDPLSATRKIGAEPAKRGHEIHKPVQVVEARSLCHTPRFNACSRGKQSSNIIVYQL